jgi:hypothetical protein
MVDRFHHLLPASHRLGKLFAAPVGHLIHDSTPTGHSLTSGLQHLIGFEAMKDGIDAPFPERKGLIGAGSDRLYQLIAVHRPA